MDNRYEPALPPGFVMEPEPAPQSAGSDMPPLPAGFVMEAEPQAYDHRFGYDPDGALGGLRTAAGGFIEGVPVIGAYMRAGAERLGAGITAAFTDQTYDQALAGAQALSRAEKEANPWVDTGAQIAGGIAGTAPLVAAAPAAFGVTGASVPGRALLGGLTGGGLGAADGGVRNGVAGAVVGGGLGAGLGFAGPIAGNLYGRGAQAFQNARADRAAAEAVGTSREAVNVVARAMGADNAMGGGSPSIAAAGPSAMLADAGPSTLSVLDTAIQRAGPGAGGAAQRINARAAGATNDINAALDTAFGAPQAVGATERSIRQGTAGARSSAYDAAYEAPIDYAAPLGREVEDIIANRVPASAIRRANDLMRTEGHQSRQILADIGDDGTVTYRRLPDVRQIDYITRALNDVAEEANGQGALGGTTAIGRAYQGLSRELRGRVRELVPEYGVALDTAAEPIAARNALRFGETLLRPQTTRDDVAEFTRGLSQAELGSLRSGVRAHVDETLANVRRTMTDPSVDARQGIAALRDLSSDAARTKIATILPQEEADTLFRSMDQAARAFELRAGVTTNSRTFGRQATAQAVDEMGGPGILSTAAGLRPLRVPQMAAETIFDVGPGSQLARKDRIYAQIADLLTQNASAANQTIEQAINDAAAVRPLNAQRAAIADAMIARGLAYLAPQGGKLPEGR